MLGTLQYKQSNRERIYWISCAYTQ